jgi:inosine-uridine nucleoside N-ribohydrolase
LSAHSSIASQLASESWRLVVPRDGPNQYYFWDTLTAAAILDRNVVRIEELRVTVLIDGPSQGRTLEDQNGSLIEVALDTNREKVENMFLDVLTR